LAFNPIDSFFVAATNASDREEGILCVWNVKTLKLEQKIKVEPTTSTNSITFNHNGSMLVSGAADGMIRIFDMTNYSAIMGWRGHEGEVSAVRFSHDETNIYSLGTDGKIFQWSIHNIGRIVQTYNFDTKAVAVSRRADIAFDEAGKHFAVGSRNGVTIFKTNNSTPVQQIAGHNKPVICIDWMQNTILSGSVDNTIKITKLKNIEISSPL